MTVSGDSLFVYDLSLECPVNRVHSKSFNNSGLWKIEAFRAIQPFCHVWRRVSGGLLGVLEADVVEVHAGARGTASHDGISALPWLP